MAWWYLATPLLARFAPSTGVLVSVAIAFASGFFDLSNGLLAISRSLAFLPYFALGYYMKPAALERLAKRRVLWLAVAGAVAIVSLRLVDVHAYDWFFQMVYGDNPFASAGAVAGIPAGSPAAGAIAKFVTMGIAALFSLAVLRLIPHGASHLTTLGERTLQIYVLHRLIRAALTFRTPVLRHGGAPRPAVGGRRSSWRSPAASIVLCSLKAFTPPFTWLMAKRWLPR